MIRDHSSTVHSELEGTFCGGVASESPLRETFKCQVTVTIVPHMEK